MNKRFWIIVTIAAFALAVLYACGQNSSNSGIPASAAISGVAADSAPISGTVTLQDSSSPSGLKTAQTDTRGWYTMPTAGLRKYLIDIEARLFLIRGGVEAEKRRPQRT